MSQARAGFVGEYIQAEESSICSPGVGVVRKAKMQRTQGPTGYSMPVNRHQQHNKRRREEGSRDRERAASPAVEVVPL